MFYAREHPASMATLISLALVLLMSLNEIVMRCGWWLVALVAAAGWSQTDSCSCMPQHPQTHFCNADFVLVGRVQRVFRAKDQGYHDVYKVKIRNVFKATAKAQVALRAGRLLSAAQESLCGVTLQPKETYLITGRISQLEAHISLCGYISKWREVTPRQRKGFRMLYRQGCTCKVQVAMGHFQSRRPLSPNTCRARFDDCYERHGVCLHNRSGRCGWTRAPKLTRCIQMQRFNGTMT